ncbi:MAG: response regulator transcription factor [Chloroflexi bacterium]|nr:response regulator transcription factor [Chloroflexota bacterium]MCH8892336.1 response regulator transcription factor [Chloroflexota bacterium]
MSGERVLVIDDDPELSEQVSDYLVLQGLEVSRAVDGDEALTMVAVRRYDLVLLDVIMPGIDGFAVCRKIRETSQVPIIMATAIGDESAKIQMLQAGADDYVVKPYSLPELHARINAVLRRATAYRAHQDIPEFTKDDLRIDYLSHEVTVSGKDVELTSTEFNLLKELATHAGEVLTHRALLHAVWGAEYGEEREYVRVFVNRLRQKLGDDPVSPRFIKTEAGVGYRFIKGE